MIAFASMLVHPAEEAGISVPPDPEKYAPNDYPHWHVYTTIQLGAGMPSSTSHWHNAEVVAKISKEKIMKVTLQDLLRQGLSISF